MGIQNTETLIHKLFLKLCMECRIQHSINNNSFTKFQAIKKQGTRLALI